LHRVIPPARLDSRAARDVGRRTGLTSGRTSSATGAGVNAAMGRHALSGCPSTSSGAGLRLPVRERVIRRGRFSRATSRIHSQSSATWPEQMSSSLFPPGGAHGVLRSLRRFAPDRTGGRAWFCETPRLNEAELRFRSRRSFQRAFLLVRAHVLVNRSRSRPDLFSSG